MNTHAEDESPEASRMSRIKQAMRNLEEKMASLEEEMASLETDTLSQTPETSMSIKRFWLVCFG